MKCIILGGVMKNICKNIIAMVVVISMFLSLTGFRYYEGFGNAFYDGKKQIFKDTYYGEQIGKNGNGNQHAYFVEANLATSGLLPIVYNGAVRSSATVGNMVNYMQGQGFNVIAAINGDLFDTASNAPKGFTMHNGNIVSSGYQPEDVIVFDASGRASVQPSSVIFNLKGEIAYDSGNKIPQYTDANGVNLEVPIMNPEFIRTSFVRKIDFVNIPHGGAQGLHFYNRHYASSTKTSGSCIEVVVDCGNSDATQLRVGKTLHGTVKAVNVDARNTPIGENEIILSTPSGSASASQLYSMVVGSNVEIEVSSNGNVAYDTANEAIGVYYTLLRNGNFVTPGTNLNPRTALGIKEDGSIMLYVLDGRSSNSKGLGLTDLAKHMKSLGCTDVVNLDGGGSSTFYTRLSGKEDSSSRKNKPSGGGERRVTNGIMLAYKTNGWESTVNNIAVYPVQTLLMPKASVQLEAIPLNSRFEKVGASSAIFNLESGGGSITPSGLYTAGEQEGEAIVTANIGNAIGKTAVTVVKNNLTITPSVKNIHVKPGESKDINMKAMQGNIHVITSDLAFNFSCDENIGTIDANGNFTATQKNGEKGNIRISFDNYSITIPVLVGEEIVGFKDIQGHWAAKEIMELSDKGIVSGTGQNLFNPDGELTRAQFLAMLAKLSKEDVKTANKVFFYDVAGSEWFASYVYWGIAKGISKGTNPNEFSPNNRITREQMCTMLCNYAEKQNIMMPQINTGKVFKDQVTISSWARDYVVTAAGAGIIDGNPDGSFNPKGAATRAQAAKVIYKFLNMNN